MSIFETLLFWENHGTSMIEIDGLHYVEVDRVNNILDSVDLVLNDTIYKCEFARLLNCYHNNDEYFVLFVPIEWMDSYIKVKV